MMGGEYYTPHIFKEAKETPLREVKYYDIPPTQLKLSPETVKIFSYACWGVVNEGGTAGGVGFPRELNIGGKTGTAQVIAMEKAGRGKRTPRPCLVHRLCAAPHGPEARDRRRRAHRERRLRGPRVGPESQNDNGRCISRRSWAARSCRSLSQRRGSRNVAAAGRGG